MVENVNPLMDFARVIECSTKLPTNGSWYNDDDIMFNSIGEVDIKPMLPRDEMLMANPETLISGESIVQVIKSCCPSIKNPENLYYPDVNALLLGIKRATYGDDIDVYGICPKCLEKRSDSYNEILKNKTNEFLEKKVKDGGDNSLTTEEYEKIENDSKLENDNKFMKLEENGEVNVSAQKKTFSIDWILNTMKFLPSEKIIESENGLKIYLTPYKCKDKTKFSVKNIHSQKVLQNLYNKIKDLNDDDIDEQNKLSKEINETYTLLTHDAIEIMSSAISKIITPNNIIVDNPEHIREFLVNSDVNSVHQISNIVDELTNIGVRDTLPFKCECCGYEWEEPFHGYNPSDFFGNRS